MPSEQDPHGSFGLFDQDATPTNGDGGRHNGDWKRYKSTISHSSQSDKSPFTMTNRNSHASFDDIFNQDQDTPPSDWKRTKSSSRTVSYNNSSSAMPDPHGSFGLFDEDETTPTGDWKRQKTASSHSNHSGIASDNDSPASTHTVDRVQPEQNDNPNGRGASDNLFYAYARRTDHPTASRFMLTFQNADVAQEWWELVEKEYPGKGVRNGPQLFSFDGDDFLESTWENQKFESLKTKWFYSQFGDASSTGGRQQDVIPLQDARGYPVSPTQSTAHQLSPPQPTEAQSNGSGQLDLSELSASLQRIQQIMEQNAAQIKTLAEGQAVNQDMIEKNAHQIQSLTDGQVNVQKTMKQNTSHIKKLSTSQTTNHEQLKQVQSMVEQNASQIKTITEGQSTDLERMQSVLDKNASQVKIFTKKQTAYMDRLQTMMEQNATQSKQFNENQSQSLERVQVVLDQSATQISRLTESQFSGMERVQSVLDQNSAQIKTLAENQSRGMDRVQAVLDMNSSQIKNLTKNQSSNMEQVQFVLDQNATQIKNLTKRQLANLNRMESVMDESSSQLKDIAEGQQSLLSASKNMLMALTLQQQQDAMRQLEMDAASSTCDHQFKPPPRKLDQKVVGYAYAPIGTKTLPKLPATAEPKTRTRSSSVPPDSKPTRKTSPSPPGKATALPALLKDSASAAKSSASGKPKSAGKSVSFKT